MHHAQTTREYEALAALKAGLDCLGSMRIAYSDGRLLCTLLGMPNGVVSFEVRVRPSADPPDGVDEHYHYDPAKYRVTGWVRDGAHLRLIDPIDGWTSPRLGVRFEADGVSPWRLRGPDGAYLPRYDQLITAPQRAERLEAKLQALGIDPDSA